MTSVLSAACALDRRRFLALSAAVTAAGVAMPSAGEARVVRDREDLRGIFRSRAPRSFAAA